MGVGEDIRTLKEAIVVGRRHGVRGGKQDLKPEVLT